MTILLVLLTFAVQRVLGTLAPDLGGQVLLPMVWLVAWSVRHRERRWPFWGLFVGLGWDLLLEPVVGPGGIAWSAAGLATIATAQLIADRTPRIWFAFGAGGALMVQVVHYLALLPLGLAELPSASTVGLSVVLTGLWCFLVGFTIDLDLPKRWREHRAKRLR